MTEATPAVKPAKKAPAKKADQVKKSVVPGKKPAKPIVKTNEKKAAPAPKAEKAVVYKGQDAVVFDQFKVRPNSLKEKLLRYLLDNLGKKITSSDLQTLLYAKPSEGANGALRGVLKGINVAIEKEKLGYELHTERVEGVTYFWLKKGAVGKAK